MGEIASRQYSIENIQEVYTEAASLDNTVILNRPQPHSTRS